MKHMLKYIIIIIPIFFILNTEPVSAQWYKDYEKGMRQIKKADYKGASAYFLKSISSKSKDSKRERTYGMHFIKYFPNRELGICYFHLGDMTSAKRYLEISLAQAPSPKAQQYLAQMKKGKSTKGNNVAGKMKTPKETPKEPPIEEKSDMLLGQKTIKLVGERMNIAVFPFENKGASKDLGEIILDKMITVLYNQGRFEMMERDKLNRVLAEQSLGQTGVIDAASAANIGKGIGVDAIVIGSVAASSSGALSIDARVIDTESAAIIVAQDIYTGSSNAQSVKNAVENLAKKITEDLPLIQGFIIKIDGEDLILDVGRNAGLKKGMKCHVYREGKEIKHPITGEILGKETKILGEILVREVFDKYSVSSVLNNELGSVISLGDKFLTK